MDDIKNKEELFRTGIENALCGWFGTSEGASEIASALNNSIYEATKDFLEENKDEILNRISQANKTPQTP